MIDVEEAGPRADHHQPLRWMAHLRGAIAMALLIANTLLWGSLLFAAAALKLALPFRAARRRIDPVLNAIANGWVAGNGVWMGWTQHTVWDVSIPAGLRPQAWYLVSCNHQSWVDIFVLQRTFLGRVPLLKFFLKQELLFVPVMGLAWWALDFPFVRRHSRQRLRQRPHLRQRNEQAALGACERFALVPTTVANFVEGTRFTARKQAIQASPYRHLLKPRVGAMASSLQVLGPQLSALLDVTIVYPDGAPSFWRFLCGEAKRIVVRCHERQVPDELRPVGDEAADPMFRARLARWLAEIWEQKDREIGAILAPGGSASSSLGGSRPSAPRTAAGGARRPRPHLPDRPDRRHGTHPHRHAPAKPHRRPFA